MVNPLIPAAGLLKSLLPVGASLAPRLPDVPGFLSKLTSLLGGLFGGSSEPASAAAAPEEEKETEPKEDEALLAQLLMRDPVLREALRKEVDRRLNDDISEDPETTSQLERLRDLLKKFEPAAEAAPAAPAAGVEGALASLQQLSDREGWTEVATKHPGSFVLPAVDTPELAALEGDPEPLPPLLPPPAGPMAMILEESLAAPLPMPAAAWAVGRDAGLPPFLPPPGDAGEEPLAALTEARGVSGSGRGVSTKPGEADPADLVDRIVRAAKLTQSRGVARLRLVLTPPELGELRLDLSVRQKTLHATLQADRASAAEAILAQLPALREALERQGLDLGAFSVSADGAFAQAQDDSRREPGEREEANSSDEPLAAAPAAEPASLRLQIMDLKA